MRTQPPSPPGAPAMPSMSPRDLLRAAHIVLDKPAAVAVSAWPRSVALLTRQALEVALKGFWEQRAAGMDRCSATTQLVALPFYLDDPGVARSARQTWCALSAACHHHGYDLAPTASELRAWIDAVASIVAHIADGQSVAAAQVARS